MHAFIWVFLTLICSAYHHTLYIKGLAPSFDLFQALGLLYGQSFFGWLILTALCYKRDRIQDLTINSLLFIARGLFAIAGHLCLMYALCVFGLSQVALSSYVGFILTAVGSLYFIEKTVSFRNVAPLFIALLGLILTNQKGIGLEIGFVWPLLSAVFFSFSSLIAKELTQKYSKESIVWGLLASMTLGLFFLLLVLDSRALLLYGRIDFMRASFMLGVLYAFMHLILIKSYQNYPLSYITLLKTSKVPLALFLDSVYYHRFFSSTQLFGACLICLAMLLRECVNESHIQIAQEKIRQFVTQLKVLS